VFDKLLLHFENPRASKLSHELLHYAAIRGVTSRMEFARAQNLELLSSEGTVTSSMKKIAYPDKILGKMVTEIYQLFRFENAV